MLCSCGRPLVIGLTETDADKKAIEDLSRQANSQTGVIAKLTRSKVEQLRAELKAEESFAKALKKSRGEIVDALNNALNLIDPSTLASMSNDQLTHLILQSGLGGVIDTFIDQQDRIRDSIGASLNAVDPTFNFNSIASQVDTLQIQNTNAVFDEIIIPTYQKSIRESLRNIALEVPISTAMSNLQIALSKSEGSALTEVRTKISQYGRSVTAVAATAAGLSNYLYTGPRDGITRPFCRALINLVVDDKQMKRLDNDQGLAVITSGGGYNCRHSWSPVTEGFIKAARLKRATSDDIKQANKGATK